MTSVGVSPVIRWGRVTAPTRAALLVIAVHLAVRAWLIFPGAYFQDDFTVLRAAREEPFGLDYLLRSGNGHLSPGTFLTGWVLSRFPGFLPAALDLMILQALASGALWLLLRRAVGNRMSAVVGLAMALFTPLMLTTVTWWAAGEVMLALQLAMATAGYCHLRYVEVRRFRWLAAASAAMVAGLFFGEKALFVPVVMLLLTIVVGPGGLRRTVRLLFSLWRVWLVYGLLGIAYLWLYFRYAELGEGSATTVGDALGLARSQLLDVFARGLLGGPWNGSITTTAQWLPISAFGFVLLVQVYLVVGLVAFRISGRRSLLAWGVLGTYLALNIGLTIRGRGLFAALLRLDPRYVCDALPLAAVCVAVMFTPAPGRESRLPGWAVGRSVAVGGLTVVALFNSSMVSTARLAETLHHHPVSTYIDNARASLLKDPATVLYDGFVPDSVMIGLFPEEEKRVSSVLAAYDVQAHYDRPSPDMKILDTTGVARPVTLAFTQNGVIGRKACGVAVEPGRSAFVQLDQIVPRGQWVMRVDYFTSTSAVLDVTTTGAAQPVGFRAGPRTVFVPVEGGASYVQFTPRQTGATVCVTGLTIGLPVPGQS